MNFGDALAALKIGYKVTREGWNGKDMYVAMSPGFSLNPGRIFSAAIAADVATRVPPIAQFRPYLMMRTVDAEFVPWVASQTDLLMEDWRIVDGEGSH